MAQQNTGKGTAKPGPHRSVKRGRHKAINHTSQWKYRGHLKKNAETSVLPGQNNTKYPKSICSG